MGKDRLYYLDMAKGISIMLVILGHILITDNPIKKWLYSFHLPLFFIISGCILSIKSIDMPLSKRFKNRLRSLIIPYFCFSIISFGIWVMESLVTGKVDLTCFWYTKINADRPLKNQA